MTRSPIDENRVHGLIAKSDADDTPVVIEADPTTHRLKVNATITGSVSTGGLTDTELRATPVPVSGTTSTQYTSGTVQPTPIGNVAFGIGDGNALLPMTVDTFQNLNVKIADGNQVELNQLDGNASLASIDTKFTEMENLISEVSRLINTLKPLAATQGLVSDLRVTLLSGTLTTLTGQTNMGGFGAQHTIMNQMNTNVATAIRSNIAIT